jgi:hypothetical protein
VSTKLQASAATATSAPSPQSSPSPAPLGLIAFTVTGLSFTQQTSPPRILTEVAATSGAFGAGSTGSLTLTALDTALDHLRVGDVLTLQADPRKKA